MSDTTAAAPTWQQRKSAKTREKILEATIESIFELGYNLTTTDKIAARAQVSRGAMLHHFPNRQELIIASVRYLNAQRLENFLREEQRIQTDKARSHIGAGIAVYWKQLASPLFVVFQELQVLSRTDPELRQALDAAMADYDTAWQDTVERVFPDLIRSRRHEMATLITQYLCEGMALYRAQRLGTRPAHPETTAGEAQILDALTDYLRTSYSDVRPLKAKRQNRQG